MRLKPKDIPKIRLLLQEKQGHACVLCGIDLRQNNPCLDHDHQTGRIRGVLCGNCNGIEGKVFNLARRAKRERTPAEFLTSVLSYWEAAEMYPYDYWHPKHRTADEKRVARNRKARLRRKKNKLTR